MSRVGNKIINIPAGVELKTAANHFTAKGQLGELSVVIPPDVDYKVEDGVLSFSRRGDRPQQRSDHGLARALVNNLVVGVSTGFTRVLEMEGTGFKWEARPDKVVLNVGFSHSIEIKLPPGIKAEAKGGTMTISGADKQLVGFVASQIRDSKRVEPYKGKGIRYQGEFVRRKAGKAGAK
jgi:large subunit ribosomal protein L6